MICFGGIHDHHKNLMRMVSLVPSRFKGLLAVGLSLHVPFLFLTVYKRVQQVLLLTLCVFTLLQFQCTNQVVQGGLNISRKKDIMARTNNSVAENHLEFQRQSHQDSSGYPALFAQGSPLTFRGSRWHHPFFPFWQFQEGVYLKPSRQY